MSRLDPDDASTLAAQMGRPMLGAQRVAVRCALGLPVILEVHPDLDGRPFPTLFYLTCPLARRAISRLEASGAVRELQARLEDEPAFARAFEEAERSYVERRAAMLPPDSPLRARLGAGVGGTPGRVKCLHAHYAHARAGGENPVGAEVARRVGPLECATPCVKDGARDPLWAQGVP